MTTVLISRDPFAREELTRELIPMNERTRECKWCGNIARFRYYVETDGGRRYKIAGAYCSIGCMRAYTRY